MPVYLRNGRRLGRTEEIGHAVDYLHVQEGRLLIKDWYIPIDVVEDVSEDGVRLNTDRRQMVERRLNVPPEDYLREQGATPGYEYTSPRDLPNPDRMSGAEDI